MKKRFPRFSLRALVIAVLGIAVFWTLTATWGIANVFDVHWNLESFERVQEGNELHLKARDGGLSPEEWRVRGTAIAPFLIKIQYKYAVDFAVQKEPSETIYFWFFGFQRVVSKTLKPKMFIR